jgi:sugar phosphate permease
VLATPALWPVNVSVLFAYGGYFSLLTFLPAFFVRQRGFSPTEAGLVTALVTAGTIVSWPLAGYASDRSRRPKAVYLLSQAANVLVCAAFAFLVPRISLAGAALVALVTGLVVGGMVTPYVIVIEMFPRDLAGTATGVINAACFAGAMILPVILGRVVDVTGSFPAAFLVAGAVQTLALLSGLLIRSSGHAGHR